MRFARLFAPAIALAQLLACGGGGGGDPVIGPPPIARIDVSAQAPVLTVGSTTRVSATLYDSAGNVITGRAITWRSSDTTVASVGNDGTVTALKAGPARITATAGGIDGSTDITVNDAPPAAVDRVTVSPSTRTLEEGTSGTYTATAYDAQDKVITGRGVTWTVQDPSVAVVAANGEVTALRPGMTIVSARIDGRTATATVRIEANYAFELIYGRYDSSSDPAVYALDIRDPAAVARPFNLAGRVPQQAVPSPDGLRVAYVVLNLYSSAIYVADRDGRNPVALIDDGSLNDQPDWSPDGASIAFRRRPIGGGTDIWVMNSTDGGNARNLTAGHGPTNQGWPAFSPVLPDGSVRIAYSHAENGAAQIWSMRADGSDRRPVTTSPAVYDDQPGWSPDGSRLVFQRSGDAIFGDIYVVDATGGSGRLLMQLAGPLAGPQVSPTWSPDGRLVAFASRHEGSYYQVYTVWFDGTRLARRTSDSADHDFPRWMILTS